MGKIRILKEGDFKNAGNSKTKIYPVTLMEAVYDNNGVPLPKLLEQLTSDNDKKSYVDLTPYAKLKDSAQQIVADSLTGQTINGTIINATDINGENLFMNNSVFIGDNTSDGDLVTGIRYRISSDVDGLHITSENNDNELTVPIKDGTVAVLSEIPDIETALKQYAKLYDTTQAITARSIAVDRVIASGPMVTDGQVRVGDAIEISAKDDTHLAITSDDHKQVDIPLTDNDTVVLKSSLASYATLDAVKQVEDKIPVVDTSLYAKLNDSTQSITAQRVKLDYVSLGNSNIPTVDIRVTPTVKSEESVGDIKRPLYTYSGLQIADSQNHKLVNIPIDNSVTNTVAFLSDLQNYVTESTLSEYVRTKSNATLGDVTVSYLRADSLQTKTISLTNSLDEITMLGTDNGFYISSQKYQTMINFPRATGTVALTSDLTGFITSDSLKGYLKASDVEGSTLKVGGLTTQGSVTIDRLSDQTAMTVGGRSIFEGMQAQTITTTDGITQEADEESNPNNFTITYEGGGNVIIPAQPSGTSKTVAFKEDLYKAVTTIERMRLVSQAGLCVFDTTLNKPVWYTGTNWVDATGTDVDVKAVDDQDTKVIN